MLQRVSLPSLDKNTRLKDLKTDLDRKEEERFSPFACLSRNAMRRTDEEMILAGHRQNFSLDADRILHSLAYSRYIDKTQVFYLIKNDHITHRVLHVQLVSKVSRTIGRLLGLNEDLIEAIALGHDIGHPPFGHDGERFLSELCQGAGLGYFSHNVQGVRFLEHIERKGRGWNLTLQVLDGILCHNGEIHTRILSPDRGKTFERIDREMTDRENDATKDIPPMTLEGCVVRMADTISYVGRDIEDAIRLGLITREEIPDHCRRLLGDTNGNIVYTLVEDLVSCSLGKDHIAFSEEVSQALLRLKAFNHERIYMNNRVKKETPKLKLMFQLLFEKYLHDLETGNHDSDIDKEFMAGKSPDYRTQTTRAAVVRDFIAGMTDDYFLTQCHKNLIPQWTSTGY